MTFKAAAARAEAEREAAGEYEKTTRAFASARAKALRELASGPATQFSVRSRGRGLRSGMWAR